MRAEGTMAGVGHIALNSAALAPPYPVPRPRGLALPLPRILALSHSRSLARSLSRFLARTLSLSPPSHWLFRPCCRSLAFALRKRCGVHILGHCSHPRRQSENSKPQHADQSAGHKLRLCERPARVAHLLNSLTRQHAFRSLTAIPRRMHRISSDLRR